MNTLTLEDISRILQSGNRDQAEKMIHDYFVESAAAIYREITPVGVRISNASANISSNAYGNSDGHLSPESMIEDNDDVDVDGDDVLSVDDNEDKDEDDDTGENYDHDSLEDDIDNLDDKTDRIEAELAELKAEFAKLSGEDHDVDDVVDVDNDDINHDIDIDDSDEIEEADLIPNTLHHKVINYLKSQPRREASWVDIHKRLYPGSTPEERRSLAGGTLMRKMTDKGLVVPSRGVPGRYILNVKEGLEEDVVLQPVKLKPMTGNREQGDGKSFKVNNVSPVARRDRKGNFPMVNPYAISRDGDAKNFNLATAPTFKVIDKMSNVRKKASDNMAEVKLGKDKNALLNDTKGMENPNGGIFGGKMSGNKKS
jgi:hypothetical protein